VPVTALRHFDEDIERAKSIRDFARQIVAGSDELLEGDLYRSAWMFAVGALDAYFCDAYTDVLARLLRAKTAEPSIAVPALTGVLIPIEVVLDSRSLRENWKWRMSARDLMSDKNILDIKVAKSYLNKMVDGPKLVEKDLILKWGNDSKSKRWFGSEQPKVAPYLAAKAAADTAQAGIIGLAATAAASGLPADVAARDAAIAGAKTLKSTAESLRPNFALAQELLATRFDELCDRRHDCIHNCDRPKVRPQSITHGSVTKAIADIEWLIQKVDDWLEAGFKAYLLKLGFSAVTRNSVGAS
jgi:hypothetical protein